MIGDFSDSEVTVRKDELLAKIREAREQHVKDYKEALEGYWEALGKELEEKCARAAVKKDVSPIGQVKPTSHTKDYDRVIKMLEMSTADEITITENQFQQYVLDEWAWKKMFEASVLNYTKAVR